MSILVIHGPNLNMLGTREPEIYGKLTLAQINEKLDAVARELGDVELDFFQSNHEGAIIDRVQAGQGAGLAGCLINPGGLTHTSVALHDAIKGAGFPCVEVHLSNIAKREEWRKRSLIAEAALGTVQGLGWRGYEGALRALVGLIRDS